MQALQVKHGETLKIQTEADPCIDAERAWKS